MRNDWKDVFLASTGRLSRIPFVFAFALVIALLALYEAVADARAQWVTGWVFYPVFLHFAASVLAKRLHDRGRSGWWAAPILLALWVVWPAPHHWFQLAFALVLAAAAIELGVVPGEPGPNAFGPNPLAARRRLAGEPTPGASERGTVS
jgi:uncharacterized membrane protein YhaH (DUF805 family)